MSIVDGIRRHHAYWRRRREVDFLLGAARVSAGLVFTSLEKHFPRLEEIESSETHQELSRLVFVASVATSAFTLPCFFNRRDTLTMLLAIEHAMIKSSSEELRLFASCYTALHTSKEGSEPHRVLGKWVLDAFVKSASESSEHQEIDQDCELANAVGGVISGGFSNWWREAPTRIRANEPE